MANPTGAAGIFTTEYDLTRRVTNTITAAGAIAGVFEKGPVDEPVLVNSQKELVNKFGLPSDINYETWYTAYDFLSYSSPLWINRVVPAGVLNAVTTGTAAKFSKPEDALGTTTNGYLVAKTPGAIGNTLKISICPNAEAFSSSNTVANVSINTGASYGTVEEYTELAAGDILQVKDSKNRVYTLKVSDATSSNVQFSNRYTGSANLVSVTGTKKWGYSDVITRAPQSNRVHIVVIDEDGLAAEHSLAGNILEIYENVSINPTALKADGSTNYYKDLINYGNNPSRYVYATGNTISTTGASTYQSLADGTDFGFTEVNVDMGELTAGYDVFRNKNDYKIKYLLQGKARGGDNHTGLANYIIDNVAEYRKDCMVFISPSTTSLNAPYVTKGNEVAQLKAFANGIRATSYAVIDSGYKKHSGYGKDADRWVPLNGDIAGLTAKTATEYAPWYSPAGYARGKIKNTVKLAFNPHTTERDELYNVRINPVVAERGEGTLLFGDKTALSADDNSAFNRINVRMLFIAIEEAIENASKTMLFEFNDVFTRSQFKNMVEPYLRDIQGRRGIYDFFVVCDETNNTGAIIDSNQFVADIYIKPARSINYIKLNFVSVGTDQAFSEVVGDFGG